MLEWAALAARTAELTEYLTAIGPADPDPDVDRAALAQAEERWSEAGNQALLATVHADLVLSMALMVFVCFVDWGVAAG